MDVEALEKLHGSLIEETCKIRMLMADQHASADSATFQSRLTGIVTCRRMA